MEKEGRHLFFSRALEGYYFDLLTTHEGTQKLFLEARKIAYKIANDFPFPIRIYGLGYPFYYLVEDPNFFRENYSNHQFTNFIELIIGRMGNISSDWICVDCQSDYFDKNKCNSCSYGEFRPRDFFKAIPDIDIVCAISLQGSDKPIGYYRQQLITLADTLYKGYTTADNGLGYWFNNFSNNQFPLPVDLNVIHIDRLKELSFGEIEDVITKGISYRAIRGPRKWVWGDGFRGLNLVLSMYPLFLPSLDDDPVVSFLRRIRNMNYDYVLDLVTDFCSKNPKLLRIGYMIEANRSLIVRSLIERINNFS